MATAQMARGTSDSIASKSSKDDHPNALGNLPTASPSNAAYMNENGQTTATKTTSDMKQTRGMLGLHPQAPIDEEHDYAEQQEWWWARTRIALREPFAEFFGTFILVLFGDAAVAQVLLSAGQTSAPGADGYGNYQSINWGWGDSGAYLNPAVLFTNCVLRKLPWRRFPIYLIAELLGGFVAAGVVYGNYISGINSVEGPGIRTVPPSKTATAGIFCTYPQEFLSTSGMFMDEFIASAVLMFVIYALKDDSNKGQFSASGAWFPLSMFFLVFGIGACFGWQTGYAINMARDFGPRLMSYAVGYGSEVWSAGNYYFWIPIVAPFCGCLFGGILYDVFLYTGPESLMNQPWFGAKDLTRPRAAIRDRVEKQRGDGLV
ncbi:glycerol channel [Elasticomyces elasticus]|nr:glycerol channel [Elasticomyces elasticus]KAK3635646.1 glycerol channel [Elasticomyces elasticus]KAK4948889.1 glycerol channel [Elasticomyces elasticus]KAK5763989.1 glycerol channel [Elasticomyces elasticus]